MEFDPTEDYGNDKVCMGVTGEIEGYELSAYCSPDSEGLTYSGGLPVQSDDGDRFGAPFQFDVVLEESDIIIPHDADRKIREQLGEEFDEQYEQKVKEIYNKIHGSDDPVDAIMNLEPDEVTLNCEVEEDA